MPEQEKVEDPTEEYHDDSHTHTHLSNLQRKTPQKHLEGNQPLG
jgi:hypothetical protein